VAVLYGCVPICRSARIAITINRSMMSVGSVRSMERLSRHGTLHAALHALFVLQKNESTALFG
jgi:hypothetical protein